MGGRAIAGGGVKELRTLCPMNSESWFAKVCEPFIGDILRHKFGRLFMTSQRDVVGCNQL